MYKRRSCLVFESASARLRGLGVGGGYVVSRTLVNQSHVCRQTLLGASFSVTSPRSRFVFIKHAPQTVVCCCCTCAVRSQRHKGETGLSLSLSPCAPVANFNFVLMAFGLFRPYRINSMFGGVRKQPKKTVRCPSLLVVTPAAPYALGSIARVVTRKSKL